MLRRCRLSDYILTIVVLLVTVCAIYTIKQQRAMQKDLFEIKVLLSGLRTPQQPSQADIKGVEFRIGDNPVLGSGNTRLILVEFTDYECAFCSRYVRETFPQIAKEYVDRGVLRYAVIDQPLPMHLKAEKAAEAAHCAGDQGQFWEIHKLIMTQQDSLSDLPSYARSLGLNVSEFESCLAADKYKGRVQDNMALARKLEITGVPGFIIGVVDSRNPGVVRGIASVRGAVPFANFQKEIEAAIAASK